MKQTVTKLKKKHRNYIWCDDEGDFWYWDAIKEKWCVLVADFDGGFMNSDQYDPACFDSFDRVAGSVFAAFVARPILQPR